MSEDAPTPYDIRDAIIESVKVKITMLRMELNDALMMAYGARANWPESALKALEESRDE